MWQIMSGSQWGGLCQVEVSFLVICKLPVIMNQKHSARTESVITWDWTVSSTYSDLTAFSTSSVLCFHHLTTFMLRTFVSFETVEKFSLILTFIAWVLLCFYFLLFFFYLINILLRDSSSRVSYTICWISDSLSLSIVSSISSLASTFQDVIYYSSTSVFQPKLTSYDSHHYWYH